MAFESAFPAPLKLLTARRALAVLAVLDFWLSVGYGLLVLAFLDGDAAYLGLAALPHVWVWSLQWGLSDSLAPGWASLLGGVEVVALVADGVALVARLVLTYRSDQLEDHIVGSIASGLLAGLVAVDFFALGFATNLRDGLRTWLSAAFGVCLDEPDAAYTGSFGQPTRLLIARDSVRWISALDAGGAAVAAALVVLDFSAYTGALGLVQGLHLWTPVFAAASSVGMYAGYAGVYLALLVLASLLDAGSAIFRLFAARGTFGESLKPDNPTAAGLTGVTIVFLLIVDIFGLYFASQLVAGLAEWHERADEIEAPVPGDERDGSDDEYIDDFGVSSPSTGLYGAAALRPRTGYAAQLG